MQYKNYVVKKDVYTAKIKNIEGETPDITNLATNTTLNTKINEVQNKILSIINLVKTVILNAKLNEVKKKIANISNLATNIAVTSVQNKIPDHSEYITTLKFNRIKFIARLKLGHEILIHKNNGFSLFLFYCQDNDE